MMTENALKVANILAENQAQSFIIICLNRNFVHI
jgi:hypothetical protein